MSRVGKAPIVIPDGVSVTVKKNLVSVKGSGGELTQTIALDFTCVVKDNLFTIDRPTDQKYHKSLHGLYRSLVNNMVEGVSNGFKKEMELVGVGYKASVNGNILELNLGYSHSIYFKAPEEIKLSAVTEKGKNPIVTVEGIDKQLVGQIAAKIKSLRKVEPYKGKGIRFVGEQIRRKAGKTATK